MEKNKSIQNIEQNLSARYDALAAINLTANLYNLTEGMREGSLRAEGEEGALLKELPACILMEAGEKRTEQIGALRSRVSGRMEEITAYVDAFRTYEYLMNRAEYAFRDDLAEMDVEEEARKLLQHIFGVEDNVEVNLRIQSMVSQLPVRMTKRKFYDLLNDALSVYEGSDQSALEGFCYRIQSAAGIPPKNRKVEAEGKAELLMKMQATDFANLDVTEYAELDTALQKLSNELKEKADLLMLLQDCINPLYTMTLVGDMAEQDAAAKEAEEQLLPACRVLAEELDKILADQPVEDAGEELTQAFSWMEEKPERLSERIMKEEAAMEDAAKRHPEWKTSCEYQKLQMANKLMSTSMFAGLYEEEEKIAGKDEIEKAKQELFAAMEQHLENRDKRFVRAVMASVLFELPVFFSTHTEVMNYVLQSLNNCRDNSERVAAVELLWQMYQ